MVIRPPRKPRQKSQFSEYLLKQTEMILHDVHKNTMQDYIKYNAQCDKKTFTSKIKEQQYVYVLQPKVDRQGSKILFTDFRWIRPHIVEKALSNNNYWVRKITTNKTQILHRMRLQLLKPRQLIPDVQTTSQQWKPDHEVII